MHSDKRQTVLLIKPVLPYPPDQGTKVLSFSLIQALEPHYNVTVLARILDRSEQTAAAELERSCERVITVLAPNRRSVFHRIFYRCLYYVKSNLLRRSKKMLYDCPGAFLQKARELAREDFDLVIIEYWQLQHMAAYFPDDRVILLTHDVDMLVNRQSALVERNLLKKIQRMRAWLLEQKEEIRAYQTFDKILTLTERDRDAVGKISGNRARVEVLPFGVAAGYDNERSLQRNGREVLFMGAMSASFNRDALDFFVRRIYPHIDDLAITIVGGALPKELAYFERAANVEVVGRVKDVRPYLARATCMIVPLRFGGGLRIRILEAMSAGIPIVCSSVAIAGMPFVPEEDYLLAETPEEYAAQIERLVEDPELARRLSDNAEEKVRENYNVDNQAIRVKECFQKLINNR
ncbi:MAG: glycosyltransferase [Candidatus Latescibacterota bacterium]